MGTEGSFTEKPFTRQLAAEFIEMSKHSYYMTGLAEMDVTEALNIISAYRERTGEKISFTAWMAYCIAQAVEQDKRIQAMQKGWRRKKVVIFNDVDIMVPVERKINSNPVPTLTIIRKTNEKSVQEIHDVIRKIQKNTDTERSTGMSQRTLDFLFLLPKFIRNILIWRRLRFNPHFKKQKNGTVTLIPVGMFGKDHTYWGINLGFMPLNIVLGSIMKKPKLIDGKLENRDYLCITIKIDHIIIDGAPATRFGKKLADLVESAAGLDPFV